MNHLNLFTQYNRFALKERQPSKMYFTQVTSIIFGLMACGFVAGVRSYDDEHPVLSVTSRLVEPFLMFNPEFHSDNGVPRFIGYIPDLLDAVARLCGFEYEISLVRDGKFGSASADGSWNGMVGELVRHEADMAAAPMFQNYIRQRVVDFTTPFMIETATVLVRKDLDGNPPFHSIEELVSQTDIKYGTLDAGLLNSELQTSNMTTLSQMWQNMLQFEPSVFTWRNADGIQKALNEDYAYVLYQSTGEYATQQAGQCNLVTVDSFLFTGLYAFALPVNSPFLVTINLALLKLREDNTLDLLYNRWWYERGQC